MQGLVATNHDGGEALQGVDCGAHAKIPGLLEMGQEGMLKVHLCASHDGMGDSPLAEHARDDMRGRPITVGRPKETPEFFEEKGVWHANRVPQSRQLCDLDKSAASQLLDKPRVVHNVGSAGVVGLDASDKMQR